MSTKKSTPEGCPNGQAACPIFDEISRLRREVEKLRSEVVRDFLSGLYNSRHLDFCLSQEIERTRRSRQPTTLIMIDIDYFKTVNDTYGHTAGDIVLKHVAGILPQGVRKLDICFRHGGEEFSILLPSTHLLVGTQVAERVRKRIEDTVIQLSDGNINITASFGVNTYQYNSQLTQQEFLDSTDVQLYRAKNAGRNQVCAAPQELSSTFSVSLEERAALFDHPNDEG